MGFTFPATPSISLAHPPTSNTLTRSPPRPHPIIDRRGKGRGTIARDHVEGGAHVARHRPGWINQRGVFISIILSYGQRLMTSYLTGVRRRDDRAMVI